MAKNKIIRTQKAKGIMNALDILAGYGVGTSFNVPHHILIQGKKDFRKARFPTFARPCPTIPRHGFVDSRVIKSHEDLLSLWNQVVKEDPRGEIVLGPYLRNINSSAVFVADGLLSIGKGNDGATSGRNSISIPVAPFEVPQYIRSAARIKEGGVYLESIHNKTFALPLLVQVRGGPKITGHAEDFVPSKTKVKCIVEPHNDLLRWEREVKEFGKGTVVYGNGHTLASHAAIHCVLNSIPFITTKRPRIGDVLVPSKCKPSKINRENFSKGVAAGLELGKCKNGADPVEILGDLFRYSVSILHNWAHIRESKHSSWLLGSACAVFSKICVALILGEYRNLLYSYKARSSVYEDTLQKSTNLFAKLPSVFKNFYNRTWEDGFGGTPWATCTWYTYSLGKKMIAATKKSSTYLTDKESSDLITIMNKTLNLAHNNGWWFNKIVSEEDLDFVAACPGFVAFSVADIFHNIYEKVTANKVLKDIKLADIKQSPMFVDKSNQINWIKVVEILYDDDDVNNHAELSIHLVKENGVVKYKAINMNMNYESAILLESKLKTRGDMVIDVADGMIRLPGCKKPINVKKAFDI